MKLHFTVTNQKWQKMAKFSKMANSVFSWPAQLKNGQIFRNWLWNGQSGVATSPVVLRWLCDSPRMGCAWRTTPYVYVARTSNNRVIMACELYCCLLPQCEALRTCRSGFPIATLATMLYSHWPNAQLILKFLWRHCFTFFVPLCLLNLKRFILA